MTPTELHLRAEIDALGVLLADAHEIISKAAGHYELDLDCPRCVACGGFDYRHDADCEITAWLRAVKQPALERKT